MTGLVIPDSDPNQALRVRRFLMAVLVYVLTIGVLLAYVARGLLAAQEWLYLLLVTAAFNGAVYAYLRSGRNERLRDPSLTGLQMVMACLLLGVTAYLVDDARGAVLMLYLVLLMFGVLRLRGWQYSAVGLLAVLSYAAAIAGLVVHRPASVDLWEEVMHLMALAVIVPAGGFLASYVGRIRSRLRERTVDLQRAREMVYELRLQDQLTGVRNRHSIVELARREFDRAARLDLPLSVAIVDLDHFKRVNREFGHERGDALLRRVAERLRAELRSIDGLGRYGGEEFLVLLPDSDLAEATDTAQRLFRAVTGCRAGEEATSPPLAASVGVAERRREDDVWTLIERARISADTCLAEGGNRILTDQ